MDNSTLNQCVIIGGGASVREAIDSYNLFYILKDKFTIGLNYSYRWFDSTFQTAVDENVYLENKKEIDSLPLYVTALYSSIILMNPKWESKTNFTAFNTNVNYYGKDAVAKREIYNPQLVGIFALTLAINLIQAGEIFLLGYDFGCLKNPDGSPKLDSRNIKITHWYQDWIKDYMKKVQTKNGTKEVLIHGHRGVGDSHFYESKNRRESLFLPFETEPLIKIYNVCPSSDLKNFEKINYPTFFNLLKTPVENQETIRKYCYNSLKSAKQPILP